MSDKPKARVGTSLISSYIGAVAVWGIGRLVIRFSSESQWLPTWAHAVVAAASVVPLVFFVVWLRRMLAHDYDEMMQRVVLEGIALGFAIFLTLAALYLNLAAGGVYVPRLDPPDIVLGAAMLVAVGFTIAWSRYR